MSYDPVIEQKIRDAMAAGLFDNLAGAGQPIDLDAYFATPEELRLAHSLLKSNGFVPDEVALMQDLSKLKEQLAACTSEDERQKLKKRVEMAQLKVDMAMESRTRRSTRKNR